MKKITIFGKNFNVIERKTSKDSLQVKDNNISIEYKKSNNTLLKEYLEGLFYSKLFDIYDEIKSDGTVEVFGDLDFEIVEKIDSKKERVAKFKGNKMQVKLSAIVLPKIALKYIIAHELAHTLTKGHSEKFWKVVRTIYPNYKKGQLLFVNHEKFLQVPLT